MTTQGGGTAHIDTVYSSWSAYHNISGIGKRRLRSFLKWETTESETEVTVVASAGVEANGTFNSKVMTCYLEATGETTAEGTAKFTKSGNKSITIVTNTYTFKKKSRDYSRKIKCELVCPSNMLFAGTYECDRVIAVPALESHELKYYDNDELFYTQTCYHGLETQIISWIPDIPENHTFKGWQVLESSKIYKPLDAITLTRNMGVTSEWQLIYLSSFDYSEVELSGKPFTHLASYSTTLTNVNIHEGRTNPLATLYVGDEYSETVTLEENATLTCDVTVAGTHDVVLVVSEREGLEMSEKEFSLGSVTVYEAQWESEFTFSTLAPDILPTKYANMEIMKYNYTEEQWEVCDTQVKIEEDGDWSFKLRFDYDHISNVEDCETKVKLSYNHTDVEETASRSAFYTTTRHQNYSNGIYSVMFVGGCDEIDAPQYTSRVWWSYINNPLYFPDTNYAEVGSNDTGVMGLTKVGEYLGVVKQSKSTDTAVYLLYATSFDDDTTFAQRQGVQGIGALAKYSFNILNDEALFLSPQGVMAIAPAEDDEHKVLNRSFFIDGKLLEETGIESAYSFVYDGMYWLVIGEHCYVLDGNQRNSYGNDKTNLVYEAYYLENIPATCFMKMGEELWFSNEDCICRFKRANALEAYTDAYDSEGNTEVPVVAEWSTILDDDGSMHYLKTMQKKGNVVSIFPVEGGEIGEINTSAKVYVKKDANEPIYVGEVNGTIEATGDIPNELHLKKKVKKYKRLQFIIRNDKPEGFGVDSITKSYFLGNYAKK